MKGLIQCVAHILLPVLLLTGCAAISPDDEGPQPVTATTGSESDARNRARIHTELAAGYFELGNLGVALEEVNIAQKADPGYAPAFNVGGLVFAALKDERRAEESFQRALRLAPADPDVNNNYGQYLCQRKREAEGIRFFLAAVQNPLYLAPERSLVNAGICSRRRGDAAAAEDFFLRALSVRPNQPQALFQLADLAFAANRLQSAHDHMRQLVQLVSPTPEILWLGLRIERRMGNAAAEASYAHQLRNNFPQSREAADLQAGRFP
jgi:type IV pilus assembly protein PilF